MLLAGQSSRADEDLVAVAREAVAAAESLLAAGLANVRPRVAEDGRPSAHLIDREQRAAHGLAWLATYVEAMRQATAYAAGLSSEARLGEVERLTIRIGLGECLAQIIGGIPMSPGEIFRLSDLGLNDEVARARLTSAAVALIASGNTADNRRRLVELLCARPNAEIGTTDPDETLVAMRAEMRKFADNRIVPHAQQWHRDNAYIPLDVIAEMAQLGVFGLTVPAEYGGLGLGKQAMCVVSEELSRGYLGVGSLGTRAEIAAELVLANGTDAQKRRWLPPIAAGEIIPTAVFTEPGAGSDMAGVRTRAIREGDRYRIFGNKTWITHAARADLMTLLVRTDPASRGHRGLSMLLAQKPRGTDAQPFPVPGLSGSEIEVIGYRGMKEFELAFDGFEVPAANLLGGVEGDGFRQLMQTFEAARIQTAARAIGVAHAAFEQALSYAQLRRQFGKPIVEFPRVADKIAMMAAEILLARRLTYHAARVKDSGRRSDLEAGMAKLYAARAAWSAADNAVQIHGGNGFALEFAASRILCDARILSIFEGAAEIQAQIIARRLLDGSN
ncbi:MAG TPA: acyl-CoA dehydrogenase family protein [Xanthobacteraceae bacterium]|nr:acyl-CoA dehydrogenase family protein [Xanthobacteraceae bacterium]